MSFALFRSAPTNPPPQHHRRRCSSIINFNPSASYGEDDKRVSFNRDVRVKRISASSPSLVTSETSINNAIILAQEAKRIFEKLKVIPENNLKSIENIREDVARLSSTSPMSSRETSKKYYGLNALNDLDMAVNGSRDSPGRRMAMSPSSASSLRRIAVENSHHYDHPTSDSSRRQRRTGDSDFMSTTEETSSERQTYRDSPGRSRTYFTDSDILRSPTEVLYAVSDKNRDVDDQINYNIVHSSSQTLQSELMRRRGSEEDFGHKYHHHTRRKPINPRMTQSLNSSIEEDKENSHKTRIHVISPERQPTTTNGRNPYKTTINTATDNIHYKREASFYDSHGHYKVPRNKPVAYRHPPTDSDSSSRYYANRRSNNGDTNNNANNHFASTRLVKNVETRKSELDREGRRIRRSNGRTLSGCSTSPDREGSVERYSKPRVPPIRSYSNHRSPSSSPTRPPRSKSSPGRDPQQKRDMSKRHDSNGNLHYRGGSKNVSTMNRKNKVSADEDSRLSKFIEYRGGEDSNYDSAGTTPRNLNRRSSVIAHNDHYNEELARERGQSLPPGATIDSMGEFYKSNQFKSMYALPPSPNRPAPILDRVGGAMINRKDNKNPRTSNSEDEDYTTDPSGAPTRGNKIIHRESKRRALSPPRQYHPPSSGTRIQIKQTPSSGGDSREDSVVSNGRRVLSADRAIQSGRRSQYPNRRRQSVDGTLDSSFSESDGFIGDNEQNSPAHPWSSSLSTEREDDLIEDEIAGCFSEKLSSRAVSVTHMSSASTPAIIRNSNTAIIRLHPSKEYLQHHHNQQNGNLPLAFTKIKREGGHVVFYDDQKYNNQDRPNRGNRRWISGSGNSDLDSDYRRELATHGRTTLGRSKKTGGSTNNVPSASTTKSLDRRYRERHPVPGEESNGIRSLSREEERRRLLQMEEQRSQRIQKTPSRSGSRLGRVLGLTSKKQRHLSSDPDSHIDGSPKSSASTTRSNSVPKMNRYDQNTRVKRNSSSAQGGVRREINRKKMPGSLTSSVNSSESEGGGGANRSVFLHTTAVADIPIPAGNTDTRRTLSESRENMNLRGTPAMTNANLQKSQKISRSISLLAPWKPRNYKDKFEIHYDNDSALKRGKSPGKPPRPPSSSRQTPTKGSSQNDKKYASSGDLLRREDTSSTMSRRHRSGVSTPVKPAPPKVSSQSSNSKVSRSVSMPKDTRLAGFFRKRKKA